MRVFPLLAGLLLGLSLLSPHAMAQDPGLLLYLTEEAGPAAGCDFPGAEGYLLAPALPADGSVPLVPSSVGSACTTRMTWQVDRAGTLDGPATISLTLSCDDAAVIGATPATSHFRFILSHDGFSQTTTLFGQEFCGGPAGGDVTVSTPLGGNGLELAPGKELRLDVVAWHSDTADMENVRAVIPATVLTLPVPASAAEGPRAQVIREDLAGVTVEHSFANATSDAYHLNFTTGLANSTASFAWNATAGSLNATLTDAAGTVLFAGAFEGNDTLAQAIVGATPGTWNLSLEYDAFHGTFGFALLEPEVDTGDPADGVADAAGNTTGNETVHGAIEDQESPWPVLPLMLVLLVAVAVRKRR